MPAASGGKRAYGCSAAVEECEEKRKPEAFFGHRKAAQGKAHSLPGAKEERAAVFL